MKFRSSSSTAKTLFFAASAVLMMSFFSSCARKTSFSSSSVVPAARGDVKVKKDNNNNYTIKVEIRNLAEPNRLEPPRNAYVVWLITSDNTTKNIGQIKSSSGFLSNNLKASIETVSSFKPTKIFITAEDDASVSYPGNHVILTTPDF